VRLEFAEDPQELCWSVADPSRHDDLTGGVQGDHLRALAVQVHPDVHHDRACVLSLAEGRTLGHALSTGAEAPLHGIKRVGHGFRNFANYRLRLPLRCGITWQTQRTTRLLGRSPYLVA
jgi:hypothetical protein